MGDLSSDWDGSHPVGMRIQNRRPSCSCSTKPMRAHLPRYHRCAAQMARYSPKGRDMTLILSSVRRTTPTSGFLPSGSCVHRHRVSKLAATRPGSNKCSL